MTIKVNGEFFAKDTRKAVEREDVIIIIDVLRFGSSSLTALFNGAKEIIPVKTLKEAYGLHEKHPGYLLAGERLGLRPAKFDFGNSPLEFAGEKVQGRIIVYTTTSGTSALTRSKTAKWILIGTFLNAQKTAEKAFEIAEKEETNISLVQSGAKGQFSLEDFLCAGAITERFAQKKVQLSGATLAAFSAFRCSKDNLLQSIMNSEHAQYLKSIGFEKDIEFCCRLDLVPLVPAYKDGALRIIR